MERTRLRPRFLWIVIALSVPGVVEADDYVNESRTITGPPQSTTERFTFLLGQDDPYPHFELKIEMSQGRADLQIFDPAGRRLQSLGAESATLPLQPILDATTPGTYTLELVTTGAVGQWHLRVCGGPKPAQASIWPDLIAALGMMLVAMASVRLWRMRWNEPWRWLWAGAALWTVAVAVKFTIAIPLNQPLFEYLKSSLPHWSYLTVGSIYGGAMTGVTEILFVFIAALIWRSMAATASRAAGVGVGAGAFEAALLGIGAAIATVATGQGKSGWAAALVAPAVERMIAILCHVASRLLAIMAIATRRWSLFWFGFLWLSGLDGVATFLYLTGQVSTLSPLFTEALLVPFGLISIPIIRWCIANWPTCPEQSLSPSEANNGCERDIPITS